MSDESERPTDIIGWSEFLETISDPVMLVDTENFVAYVSAGQGNIEFDMTSIAELYESLHQDEHIEPDWPTEYYYPPHTDLEMNIEEEYEVIAKTYVKLLTLAAKDLEPGTPVEALLQWSVESPKEYIPIRNESFENLTSAIKDGLTTKLKPLVAGDTQEVVAEWTTNPTNKPKTEIYDVNKDTDFDILAKALVNASFSFTQHIKPGCNMKMRLKWGTVPDIILEKTPKSNKDFKDFSKILQENLGLLQRSWKLDGYQGVMFQWTTSSESEPQATYLYKDVKLSLFSNFLQTKEEHENTIPVNLQVTLLDAVRERHMSGFTLGPHTTSLTSNNVFESPQDNNQSNSSTTS